LTTAPDSAAAAADVAAAMALGFTPTEDQLKYLWLLRDAVSLVGDVKVNDTAMAQKCGISRTSIWQWKQDPEFLAWLRAMLVRERDTEWDLVLDKHTQLAMRGSVRSAEFLGKLRTVGARGGGFGDAGDLVDNSIQNYQVNLLVPRPNEAA